MWETQSAEINVLTSIVGSEVYDSAWIYILRKM